MGKGFEIDMNLHAFWVAFVAGGGGGAGRVE